VNQAPIAAAGSTATPSDAAPESTLVRALETVEADLASLQRTGIPVAATVRLEPFWRPSPGEANRPPPPLLERLEPESERLPDDPPAHFLREGDNEVDEETRATPEQPPRKGLRAMMAMGLLIVTAGGAYLGNRHTSRIAGLPERATIPIGIIASPPVGTTIGTRATAPTATAETTIVLPATAASAPPSALPATAHTDAASGNKAANAASESKAAGTPQEAPQAAPAATTAASRDKPSADAPAAPGSAAADVGRASEAPPGTKSAAGSSTRKTSSPARTGKQSSAAASTARPPAPNPPPAPARACTQNLSALGLCTR